MKKLIGISILVLIFVCIFCVLAFVGGILFASIVFVSAFGLTALIAFAVKLIVGN